MAQPLFDISMLGDKELEKKLGRLEDKVQTKIMRGAMRKTMTVIKKRVVAAVPVATGKLKAAMKAQKIKSSKRSRKNKNIRISLPFPTRAELGIPADAKHYYPAAVEYGHGSVPPHSYIRKPTDSYWDSAGKASVTSKARAGIIKEALKK